jgi:hypothetical protein
VDVYLGGSSIALYTTEYKACYSDRKQPIRTRSRAPTSHSASHCQGTSWSEEIRGCWRHVGPASPAEHQHSSMKKVKDSRVLSVAVTCNWLKHETCVSVMLEFRDGLYTNTWRDLWFRAPIRSSSIVMLSQELGHYGKARHAMAAVVVPSLVGTDVLSV